MAPTHADLPPEPAHRTISPDGEAYAAPVRPGPLVVPVLWLALALVLWQVVVGLGWPVGHA